MRTEHSTRTITGLLQSIQIGLPRSAPSTDGADSAERTWTTGIYKSPAQGPVWLSRSNLAGDGQADLVHHGGLDKAVCAYPAAHWPHWTSVLPPDQLRGGAFGENFTLAQLTETEVCIGDVYSVGSAIIQISQPRQPCWKLTRRWQIKDLALQVERLGFTGWYFRVLQEGFVDTRQSLHLIDRPCPEWTVAAANRVMHHERQDRTAAERLSLCSLLSASWQRTLRQRALTGAEPTHQRRHVDVGHS